MRNCQLCIAVAIVAVLVVLAGTSGFFLARAFQGTPLPYIGLPPVKAFGYSLGLTLEVMDITPISTTDKKEFVQFKVRPYYGKIDAQSLDFFQKYETQEFTIVVGNDERYTALVRVGDILSGEVTRSGNVRGN
jgi:hypothetical protein